VPARTKLVAAPQTGVALPLVLWLIVLLIAIVGGLALTARVEGLQGQTLADGAQAQEVARAGIDYAIARVTDPDLRHRWVADGRVYLWSFAGAEVQLRVVDEMGKVDLNQADTALLAALLQALDVDASTARSLAGEIVDWRDADGLLQPGGGAEDPEYAAAGMSLGAKDAPFQSVSELHRVRGMTPEVFDRLEPHVTLFSGLMQPAPGVASAPVLTALGLDGARIRAAGNAPMVGSGTYSIESRAALADGRQAVVRATLREGGGHVPGAAYTVMRWDAGARTR
jgi:general secretion pathway protein K